MKPSEADLDAIVQSYEQEKPRLNMWLDAVLSSLRRDPFMSNVVRPAIIKGRLKGDQSVRDKVVRKYHVHDRPITPQNLLDEFDDLGGARVVVAYKGDIDPAVRCIHDLSDDGVWVIQEEIHYVWHPDEVQRVMATGSKATRRESAYCSRHFIVCDPRTVDDPDGPRKCELQLRTLLEEAIFENDHRVRYKREKCEWSSRVMSHLVQNLEVADEMLVDAYRMAKEGL